MSYRTSPRSGLFETMILHQNTTTKWSKYLMYRYPGNVSKICMLMIFETIWNCRDHFENIVSKACTLAMLETISNCKANFKTMSLKHALWRYLKRFGTAENPLKIRTVNGVFWRYLKLFETFMSRLVGAHSSPPLAFSFYCIFGYFKFSTFKKSCRPGPTRHTRSHASARG